LVVRKFNADQLTAALLTVNNDPASSSAGSGIKEKQGNKIQVSSSF